MRISEIVRQGAKKAYRIRLGSKWFSRFSRWDSSADAAFLFSSVDDADRAMSRRGITGYVVEEV